MPEGGSIKCCGPTQSKAISFGLFRFPSESYPTIDLDCNWIIYSFVTIAVPLGPLGSIIET